MKAPLRIAALSAALAFMACGSRTEPVRPAPPVPAEKPVVEPATDGVSSTQEVLPAGLFWSGYRTCPSCVGKVWLVTARVDDAPAAESLVRSSQPLKLPLGYPLVVHAGEVQIHEKLQDKVLVIYGIHAERSAAEAAVGRLKEEAVASEILFAPQEGWGQGVGMVVRFQPGEGHVRAYWPADLKGEHQALVEPYLVSDAERVALDRRLAAAKPACLIDRDAVKTPSRRDVDWYRWVPVACDGKLAYVPWRETRMMATYFDDGAGSRRMRQVVLVECDSPTFFEWKVNARGRKLGKPREVLKNEGC